MNILYVDNSVGGHHHSYLKNIIDQYNNNFFFVPDNIEIKGVVIKYKSFSISNFILYFKWLSDVRKIIKKYNIEVVHFLSVDFIKRYFGLGFHFGKAKVISTLHHVDQSGLKMISYKLLSKKSNVFVVHSDYLKKNSC